MRSILLVSLVLAVFSGVVAPAFAQTIGIVLLRGKTGSPDTVINQLAIALQGCGVPGRYARNVLVAAAHI